MSSELQKAFDVSDDEFSQLRAGELPSRLQHRMLRTSYIIMGAGGVCCLAGFWTLATNIDNVIIVFPVIFLSGLLTLYAGNSVRRGILSGKVEKMTTTIKVSGSGGSRFVILENDRTLFRESRLKTKWIQPDTVYTVYYIKGAKQIIAIELAEEA